MESLSNEEYVQRIQAGEENLIEPFWQQNQRLIYSIVNKYISLAELDDLMQEAFLGFYRAIETFDTAAKTLFSTYVTTCIKRSVIRYIQENKCVNLPEWQQIQIYRFKELKRKFNAEYNKEPTQEEICFLLDISEQQYKTLQRALLVEQIKSLDAPISTEEETTLLDLVESQSNAMEEQIQRMDHQQMKADLWQIIDSLEDEQAKVIHLRYQTDLTLQEIGERMNIKRDDARNLHDKAFRHLKKPHIIKRLKPYYDDYLAAVAYHRTSLTSFRNTFTSVQEWHILREEERKK